MNNQELLGKFITLEGIDGAGKTTQLNLICDYLIQHQIDFVVTREPGGTPVGEEVRKIILSESMSNETEALLMFACRQEHYQKLILPNLKLGKWVISDRFIDSTYAYQCGGRGMDIHKINQLRDWTIGNFEPNLTFVFDVQPNIAHQRVVNTRTNLDRFEQMDITFFENVRHYFLLLAKKNPQRICLIDGHQNIEKTSHQIINALDLLV